MLQVQSRGCFMYNYFDNMNFVFWVQNARVSTSELRNAAQFGK